MIFDSIFSAPFGLFCPLLDVYNLIQSALFDIWLILVGQIHIYFDVIQNLLIQKIMRDRFGFTGLWSNSL